MSLRTTFQNTNDSSNNTYKSGAACFNLAGSTRGTLAITVKPVCALYHQALFNLLAFHDLTALSVYLDKYFYVGLYHIENTDFYSLISRFKQAFEIWPLLSLKNGARGVYGK